MQAVGLNKKLSYLNHHHECQMREKCSEINRLQEDILKVKVEMTTQPEEVYEHQDMRNTIEMLNLKIRNLEDQALKQNVEMGHQSDRARQAIANLQAAHTLINKHLENANKCRAETDRLSKECAIHTAQYSALKSQLSIADENLEHHNLSTKKAMEQWQQKESQLEDVIKTLSLQLQSLEESKAHLQQQNSKLSEKIEELIQLLAQSNTKQDIVTSDIGILAGSSLLNVTDMHVQVTQDVRTITTQTTSDVKNMNTQTSKPETTHVISQTDHQDSLSSFVQTDETVKCSVAVQTATLFITSNASRQALKKPTQSVSRDVAAPYMVPTDLNQRLLNMFQGHTSNSHIHGSSDLTQIKHETIECSNRKFSTDIIDRNTSVNISDCAEEGRDKRVASIANKRESDAPTNDIANTNNYESLHSFQNVNMADRVSMVTAHDVRATSVEPFPASSLRVVVRSMSDTATLTGSHYRVGDSLITDNKDKPDKVCVVDSAIVKLETGTSSDININHTSDLYLIQQMDHLQPDHLQPDHLQPDHLQPDHLQPDPYPRDNAVSIYLHSNSSQNNNDEAVDDPSNRQSCGSASIHSSFATEYTNNSNTDHKTNITGNIQHPLAGCCENLCASSTQQVSDNSCSYKESNTTTSLDIKNVCIDIKNPFDMSTPLQSFNITDFVHTPEGNKLLPQEEKRQPYEFSSAQNDNLVTRDADAGSKRLKHISSSSKQNKQGNKVWKEKSCLSSIPKLSLSKSVSILNIDLVSSLCEDYEITYNKDGTAFINVSSREVLKDCGKSMEYFSRVQSSNSGNISVDQSPSTSSICLDRVQTSDTASVCGVKCQSSDTGIIMCGDRVRSSDTANFNGDKVQSSETASICGDRVQSSDTANMWGDRVQSSEFASRVRSVAPGICDNRADSSNTTSSCVDKETKKIISSGFDPKACSSTDSKLIPHRYSDDFLYAKQDKELYTEVKEPDKNLSSILSHNCTDPYCFHTAESLLTAGEETTDSKYIKKMPHSLKLVKTGKASRNPTLSSRPSFLSTSLSYLMSSIAVSSCTVTRTDLATSQSSPVNPHEPLSLLVASSTSQSSVIHQGKEYSSSFSGRSYENISNCNQTGKCTSSSIFSPDIQQPYPNHILCESNNTKLCSLQKVPLYATRTVSNPVFCNIGENNPKLNSQDLDYHFYAGTKKQKSSSQRKSSVQKESEQSSRLRSRDKKCHVQLLSSDMAKRTQHLTGCNREILTVDSKPKGILKGPRYNRIKSVPSKSVTFPVELEYHMHGLTPHTEDSQQPSTSVTASTSCSTISGVLEAECTHQVMSLATDNSQSCATNLAAAVKNDPSTSSVQHKGDTCTSLTSKLSPTRTTTAANMSACGPQSVTVPETPNLDFSDTDCEMTSSPGGRAAVSESPATLTSRQWNGQTLGSNKTPVLPADTDGPALKKHKNC